MPYGEYRPPADSPVIQLQVADSRPYQYNATTGDTTRIPVPAYTPMPHQPQTLYASLVDVGIFRDTLLPSISLHASLALAGWAAGRSLNRVDAKDWLWPGGLLVNAWWSSVGRQVFVNGRTLASSLSTLSRPESLLLTGVTLWGGRLLYRVASRSIQRGEDDPRYTAAKKEEGFWTKSLLNTFLPEALFQTLIALPFTAPFRHQGAVLTGYHPYVQALAIGIFSTGFALEALADSQLAAHQQRETGLIKDGVWSIVRHPNYLGDALMHFAFPVLLYGSDLLAPIELLGPIANYVFLRYVGGDAESEVSQEERYSNESPEKAAQLEDYKKEKNAFWPNLLKEASNGWLWTVVGLGMVTTVVEETVRQMLH